MQMCCNLIALTMFLHSKINQFDRIMNSEECKCPLKALPDGLALSALPIAKYIYLRAIRSALKS